MKKSRLVLMLVVAICLGICLGLLVRQPLLTALGHEPMMTSSGMGEPGTPSSGPLAERIVPKSKIHRTLETSSRSQRTLWLATQAEKAKGPEMAELVRMANGESELVKFLGAHWAKLDPQGMFEALAANRSFPGRSQLMRTLLKEWPKSDPDAAIAALSDESKLDDINDYRWSVADVLMQHHVDHGVYVMNEWGITSFGPNMKNVGDWAKADPAASAKKGASIMGGYARRKFMTEVGKSWGKTAPKAALEFSKELGRTVRSEFSNAAMREWAESDLDAAIAFASADENAEIRGDFASALVGEWGKLDPAAALDWSYENLVGKARANATASLIETIAKEDVKLAADIIGAMETGSPKTAAVAGLFTEWIEEDDGKHRDAAIEWLGTIDDIAAQRKALERHWWKWLRDDPKDVISFVSGEHGFMAPPNLVQTVASDQTRRDPVAALAWANNLQENQQATARNAVLETWARTQPDKATEWARSQPQELREPVIAKVAGSLAYRSMDALERWFNGLPEDDKGVARPVLKSVGLKDDSDRERMQELIAENRSAP